MSIGYYITGTDTAVGKTHASVALLHALRAQGQRAVGMKPVASGCIATADGLRNDDALALQAASDPVPEYALVNPFALPAATAPQIAAEAAGIQVSLAPIAAAYRRLAAMAGADGAVVVEGVGGWMAPLADDLDQARLAGQMGLTVILVVAVRLGCLSHARLSERAILADGLQLAGWIGNQADATPVDFLQAYQQRLEQALSAPCLGQLPFASNGPANQQAPQLRIPPRG